MMENPHMETQECIRIHFMKCGKVSQSLFLSKYSKTTEAYFLYAYKLNKTDRLFCFSRVRISIIVNTSTITITTIHSVHLLNLVSTNYNTNIHFNQH